MCHLTRLLRGHEISVRLFVRSSEGLERDFFKKCIAGGLSIYNPWSQRQTSRMISEYRPDVIHAHNIYPWITPSAFVAAERANVPVVMTVHHYGLTCPVLTHFRSGHVCTACIGGRELNCIRYNCRGNFAESAIYTLRNAVAWRMRLFHGKVSVFVVLSEFARRQLIMAGIPSERIAVRPNMVLASEKPFDKGAGDYVAYVGRITHEKGVDMLCHAARQSGIPVRIAGDTSTWTKLLEMEQGHVQFEGVLTGQALVQFFRDARFVVVPSRWWEVCPMVVLEAMNHGRAVLAADIGGLPELVEDETTGLLFRPGDTIDLVEKMTRLWNDKRLCERMGRAGWYRVMERYSESSYFDELMSVYRRAITIRLSHNPVDTTSAGSLQ